MFGSFNRTSVKTYLDILVVLPRILFELTGIPDGTSCSLESRRQLPEFSSLILQSSGISIIILFFTEVVTKAKLTLRVSQKALWPHQPIVNVCTSQGLRALQSCVFRLS